VPDPTPSAAPALPSKSPGAPITLARLIPRLVASLAVAALFVLLIRRGGVPVLPPASAFAQVKWWTVGAYFLSLFVVQWFRAYRWDYLLRPIAKVPTSRIITIAWVGFFAIMMLPLRMGEVVRPILLRRDGKISGSAAFGTIAAERVLDGLFVALLLVVTMAVVPHPDLTGVSFGGISVSSVPRAGMITAAVFGAALLTLTLFLVARKQMESLTRVIVGALSPRLADRLARMVGDLADGLRSLPDPKLMAPFLLQTAIYWGVNGLGMWFLGWGCGLPMTPGQGFSVMGVLAMGILLPSGPGLFGVFQLSVFLALRMYFPQETVVGVGAAYVFIMYASQFVFQTLTGLGALWFGHIDPRDAMEG
jgi:uncharacterized protein (TIRG00374 family)